MTNRIADKRAQQTQHFYHLAMLGVLFGILVTATAGKTVDILGVPFSITLFYFPFIYIIGDILTEVYGYSLARRALWYLVMARIIGVAIFALAAWAPPAATMPHNEAFQIVFGQSPYIAACQLVATFAGEVVNNYIVARMKVKMDGRNMAARFVASTIGSELVNSIIFYFFALGLTGIIPMSVMGASILGATILKTLVEVILLPVSLTVTRWLKQAEGLDVYDRDTDFNPLKF